METERASPSTSVSQGQGRAGASLPSTSAKAGRDRQRPHRARHGQMRRLADVDEVDLVDTGFADADGDRALHDVRIELLARLGVSCLESSRPLGMRLRSRMTAAATTGPASGPRPASSTPATGPAIVFRKRDS